MCSLADVMATGTPDSQARFGQSVKGLLTEKVNTCGTDVIALTKQVLKGSRSSESIASLFISLNKAVLCEYKTNWCCHKYEQARGKVHRNVQRFYTQIVLQHLMNKLSILEDLISQAMAFGTDVEPIHASTAIVTMKQIFNMNKWEIFLLYIRRLLGQAARNMVLQEDAILHSEDSLRKMAIITTHLQYQQEAIQKKAQVGSCPGAGAGNQACLSGGGASGAPGFESGLRVLKSRSPETVETTYYGQVLKKSADLQTNACVTAVRPVPQHIREALQNVHEEVSLRYYGCGLVIPECLENCWILDLGSGSGRDCYALSQLVGEKGHVTGIDMTEGQVEVANKYIEYHMEKYGFQASNVTFIHGYIEKLEEAGIKNESYDIVISNCVINLVPDKQQVLQEVYRVLKHGGELYFSDVYASLELPEEIRTHKVLWGECLGGALYWKDLSILAKKIGFCPPRLVTANLITVQNKELENVIGDCRFVSATFRLFKLPKTGPTQKCQVIYNGGITGHEKELIFDANFTFKKDEAVEVDEETVAILKNSRFAQGFLIGPDGEKLPTCGAYTTLEVKDVITDPFELARRSDSAESRSSPAVGGCCSAKKCS